MNRRNFIKSVASALIAPSILALTSILNRKHFNVGDGCDHLREICYYGNGRLPAGEFHPTQTIYSGPAKSIQGAKNGKTVFYGDKLHDGESIYYFHFNL